MNPAASTSRHLRLKIERMACSFALDILHRCNKACLSVDLTEGLSLVLLFQTSAAPAAAAHLSSPSAVRSPYPLHMSCHPRPEPRPPSPSHACRRTPSPPRVTGPPLALELQAAPPPSLPPSLNQRLHRTWMARPTWEVILRRQSQTA